ncbi:hypothetical protein DES48_1131, partial [Paraliobacillus ryukyuensis]
LKNGEIQLEGPEPDVDIGVEQILAAKDGYDYFTGKEISKIQSATIIFGVVFSGFSWRGSRRFSLSKMQVSKIKNNVKTTSNSVNGKINNKATVTKGTGKNPSAFADRAKLEGHFDKHGKEFDRLYKNADEYLEGAKEVINNGIKVKYEYKGEMRTGYVKFIGNNKNGKAKFEFVGTNNNGDITTYHTQSGKKIWKTINGENIPVINPAE